LGLSQSWGALFDSLFARRKIVDLLTVLTLALQLGSFLTAKDKGPTNFELPLCVSSSSCR